jgi:hypothetical protein
MVPMHLGHINGSFVPHNLISAQGSPVPCQSSWWPLIVTFNVLWIQVKEPKYVFSFSLKSPSKQTPSGFPNRPPWRELPIYRDFFTYISNSLKISLNKEVFPSLNGLRKGASLHVPQKWGPYGSRCPFPEPYLAYPLGSPVKEPSRQVPLIEVPRKEMPHS